MCDKCLVSEVNTFYLKKNVFFIKLIQRIIEKKFVL